MNAAKALSDIWSLMHLPAEALAHAKLPGREPVLPSSFAVDVAAQASIAAAALAACELGFERGQPRRDVTVEPLHAAAECMAFYSIDGRVPPMWDAMSGNFRCKDGWVRVHANFPQHRDGALLLLGLDPATATRDDLASAASTWECRKLEQLAAEQGLLIAAARRFDEWDAHPAGQSIARQPLMTLERIGDAAPRRHSTLQPGQLPLQGIRVIDATRILAGPSCGRALATYGADVMLVNSPGLPNIEMIATTSRGKLSAHADLRTEAGRTAMRGLSESCDVFLQSYRPGAMESLGFGPSELAKNHPGIVYASLSAYGEQGEWGQRKGFDSLVQTTMGFALEEAQAAGSSEPKALPVQIFDWATGFLMAFGSAAALVHQCREGGSWHLRVSLAQTAHWLRSLGRVEGGLAIPQPKQDASLLEETTSGFGKLIAVKHSARMANTKEVPLRPSMPPGSHPPVWP